MADFRTLALTTHDPIERGVKASQWLAKNSPACSAAQLSMISANRASWMGAADTVQLMGQMDGILEAKATSSPELMAALYGTKPGPARKSETVTSASAQSTTPRQTVVAGAPGAGAGPATAVVLQPGQALPPGASGVPGAPGAPGATKPPGPAGAEAKPPELQKYFNTKLRDGVRQYFTQSRGKDVCPPGTILREMRCEAILAARKWKVGEPVSSDLTLKDVPPALLERLGAAPAGHRFVMVGVDVLLLAEDMRVIDAVLDLGQVPPALPVKKA